MLVYNVSTEPIRLSGYGYRQVGEAFDMTDEEAARLKGDARFSLTPPVSNPRKINLKPDTHRVAGQEE